MLVTARTTITRRRPSRSDSVPIEKHESRPTTWKMATIPAPDAAAVMLAAPASPMQAAMKAGVHAHMPWSSQLWKLYPQIRSMARLFFTISRMIGRAVARTGSAISVFLKVSQPRSQPASGPIQVNRKERRYPPMGSVAPLMPSEHA